MAKQKKKSPRQNDAAYVQPEAPVSILSEPGQVYADAAGMATSFPDEFDQIAAARRGIRKSKLYEVAALYGVSLEELSGWLHSSYRNLQRRPDDALLDSTRTEKLLELVNLANRGAEVLGTLANFREWVHAPILALGNRRPKEFLDTSIGIRHLEHLLGRLEWGVFS
jgi:putative toxin-antitoxin system antitoxin component (TIGR02293 family)